MSASCRFFLPGCLADGGDDAGIGTAAADIAAHPFPDLVVVMGVPFPQQRHGGTDLTGRAVAALEAVVADEGRLDGVEPAVRGQALDGGDLPAAVHDGEGEAGVDA